MKEEKQTFLEMLVGIVGNTLVIGIIGSMIAPNKSAFALGAFLGGVTSVFILMLLYRSLERALSMESKEAEKYAVRAAIIRLVLMCIPLVLSILFPNMFNVLGVFFGLMGLKVSAFLQPVMHKMLAPKL